ncbi:MULTISPECIES: membrane integrity-associated transporter subunit PqiC [unclassified Acinetobacter]|uniref:PqiC family protein n=1 Tax=unclassified Acinetobacter TaxID=196816 RepID=UPI00190B6670|nr:MULTISPECIES: PqiC family protein [unclassified Acinetobacter]MBK0063136.1 membrane integrity-associated transporter subunit PqiC [Acinetobacter sp. S55]MBK0066446.1 membrane integrity-associated transporter subunit PqiC [Acinetobacter sp. S54]
MKNKNYFRLGLVATVIFVSACSSSPTPNYYTLQAKVTPIQNSGVNVIEVLPVGLPDRLDRASIVLQDNQGKSKVLDNDRWTSTLSTQLRDGLSAGLQQKLGAVDRYNSGMTAGQVSYRIATDFSNFDVIDGLNRSAFTDSNDHYINVMVTWIVKPDISAVQNSAALAQRNLANRSLSCRTSFTVPIQGESRNIHNIVVASTQSLNRIIDNIASSVVMLNANKMVNVNGVTCS